MNDVRFGWRMLRTNPGISAVAVLTLALGIGATVTIFSFVNAILLRPLPLQDPEKLVVISERAPQGGGRMSVAWLNYLDWREQAQQSFEQMAAFWYTNGTLTGLDEALRIRERHVSANFFRMVGVEPALGRLFRAEEDTIGGPPVILLSHGLWTSRFGGEAGVLGKILTINSRPYTVIGVLPRDFQFFNETDVYYPIGQSAGYPTWKHRGNHTGILVLARLRPGAGLPRANAEMSAIAERLARQYPATNSGNGAMVETLFDRVVSGMRPMLLVLLAACGLLLLTGCTNVANLMLARATARQREIAIRASLGAGRGRIIRQLLTESVLLSLIGAGLGVVMALWGTNLLRAAAPPNTPRLAGVEVDGVVLGFALALSLATAVLFGTAPALSATRVRLADSLQHRTGAASRSGRLRSALLVAEVSLALMLLVGAGLAMRSFLRLRQVDPGIRPENVLTFRVELPARKYSSEQRQNFFRTALERISTLPGVQSAGMALALPVAGTMWGSVYIVGDQPAPPRAELPSSNFNFVAGRYFETMDIPLREGRYLTDRDTRHPVAVVTETFARRHWRGQSALSKRLKQGWPEDLNPWFEIVGVVGDVRQNGLETPSRAEVFLPYSSERSGGMNIVARVASNPAGYGGAVREVVRSLDRDLPVTDLRPMERLIADTLTPRRLSTYLMGIFSLVSLVISAIGIYGVMAYVVTQRTHEIGLRMALGARSGQVLSQVVGQGMRLALAGVVIGLAGAAVLTRWMSTLLFGISRLDLATYLGVAALLAGVALLACYVPARRAARVDPMIALRYE